MTLSVPRDLVFYAKSTEFKESWQKRSEYDHLLIILLTIYDIIYHSVTSGNNGGKEVIKIKGATIPLTQINSLLVWKLSKLPSDASFRDCIQTIISVLNEFDLIDHKRGSEVIEFKISDYEKTYSLVESGIIGF